MKYLNYLLPAALLITVFAISGFSQDTTSSAMVAETVTTHKLTLWELALKGGWLMLPLAVLSVIAVYVFIERWIAIRRASSTNPHFMGKIKEYIAESRIDAAKAMCQNENTPIARLIDKGMSHLGRPLADIRESVENAGNLEIARLERGIPFLATIAGGAPMIGFLGTVMGMIEAFYNMSTKGSNVDITALSDGIYTAMVTTVAGLAVGIIAYFGYNYITTRIKNFVNKLEANTLYFMDLLNQPPKM